MEKIIFLGTGAGSTLNFYNSCFAIKKDNEYFLVDGGGGINILDKLNKSNITIKSIKNIFVTHNHLDHITGVLWIIRKISIMMRDGSFEDNVNIYASDVTIDAIRTICSLTLSSSYLSFLDNKIILNVVSDREEVNILGDKFTFYDVKAKKEKQFGFRIDMDNNKVLVCNGDETLDKSNYDLVKNADYLIHEAFCLEEEREEKKPYLKGHATSKDVCDIANSLNVKNLILYHIASEDVLNRKEKFISNNKEYFSGNLYVPNDLESIIL